MALNMSDDLHVCPVFEDASGYKCAGFLNMARLHMQRLHRVPNMPEYD